MISLVIPVYKVEAFLRECLDSVLAQTYGDFEAICVNDGSPDNCPKILEEYQKKDKRVRVIFQKNQGLSAARNTGLDNAKGEYIAFLDSDDKIAPMFLEELVTHIDGADCVEVGAKYFKEDSELLVDKPSAWFDRFLFNKPGVFDIKPSILPKIYCACWNKLYRREIIEKYHLRFIAGLIHEDNFFTYAYLMHCQNICEVGKKCYFYRNRLGSQSKNVSYEHYWDTAKNYVALAEHLAEFGLEKRFRRACLWAFVYNSLLESRMLCNRQITTALVERFAKALGMEANKILAAVEPKSFGVKIQDMSNKISKFRVVECPKSLLRIYGKNNLTVRGEPHSFSFTFDSEKAGIIKVFFGVVDINIGCMKEKPDTKIFVKEIYINGKKIGENITLSQRKIQSIMLRSKPNGRTVIDVKM